MPAAVRGERLPNSLRLQEQVERHRRLRRSPRIQVAVALEHETGVRVPELPSDFYSTDAARVVPDYGAMVERATSEFRARHPELSDDAVAALAWCYSYDFR